MRKELFEKINKQLTEAGYRNKLCVDCFMTIDVMAEKHSYAISGKVREIYDEANDIEDYGYEFYIGDDRDNLYENLYDVIQTIIDMETEGETDETV